MRTGEAYRVMHGLRRQHHNALCRRQQLHPCILCLASRAQSLIGLLLFCAHVLPTLASLTPDDLYCHRLIWMIPLQRTCDSEDVMSNLESSHIPGCHPLFDVPGLPGGVRVYITATGLSR